MVAPRECRSNPSIGPNRNESPTQRRPGAGTDSGARPTGGSPCFRGSGIDEADGLCRTGYGGGSHARTRRTGRAMRGMLITRTSQGHCPGRGALRSWSRGWAFRITGTVWPHNGTPVGTSCSRIRVARRLALVPVAVNACIEPSYFAKRGETVRQAASSGGCCSFPSRAARSRESLRHGRWPCPGSRRSPRAEIGRKWGRIQRQSPGASRIHCASVRGGPRRDDIHRMGRRSERRRMRSSHCVGHLVARRAERQPADDSIQ